MLVDKSKRRMMIYNNGELLKSYRISIGKSPVGAKEFQGDKKTPEGIYIIDSKNPNSGYHKNLGISYPNKKNIENARKQGKLPGGDIKIHGYQNGLALGNLNIKYSWTFGCIALTNKDIDELYEIIKIGTIIEIVP
jgi:murein L,D-transpeptidase YafK